LQLAQEGFGMAIKAIQNKEYNIVILDEINLAVDYGLVPVTDILHLIDSKPEEIELILTGRNVKREILEKADLVTDMVDRKHYYEKGVPAREGIER
jgi:cob(I)alamin adenosyltransferase